MFDLSDSSNSPRRRRSRTLLLDIASVATAPAILVAGALGWLAGRSEPCPATAATTVLATAAVTAAPQATSAPATPPVTGPAATRPLDRPIDDAARFSYGIGFDLGEKVIGGLRTDGQNADLALVVRGFEDALNGRSPAIPRAELERVLRAVHDQLLDRAAAKRYADDPAFKALADQNAARSAEALKVFAADKPTGTVDGGAMYKAVESGPASAAPVGDQLAIVTYSIYGADARKVDERTDATIDPGALLPAAGRILRSMRPGDHWLVAIPPDQAFGLGGEPPDIGPNEALIIDVKVRGTKPRQAADGAAPATGGAR